MVITLDSALLISAAVLLICAGILVFRTYRRKRGGTVPVPEKIDAALCGICILVTGLALWLGMTKATAIRHGDYNAPLSVSRAITAIEYSPEEDVLPDDYSELKGKIILYFRFGCQDCEDVYEDLSRQIEPVRDDVYWVSTRSEQGERLRETYPVDHVPSLVYISTTGEAFKYRLDTDFGDRAGLDMDVLKNILQSYYKEHGQLTE